MFLQRKGEIVPPQYGRTSICNSEGKKGHRDIHFFNENEGAKTRQVLLAKVTTDTPRPMWDNIYSIYFEA